MNLASVRSRSVRELQRLAERAGYELQKVQPPPEVQGRAAPGPEPAACEPVWPLPRGGGMTDDEIRDGFARFEHWHYAYRFEGGLAFDARHQRVSAVVDAPERPVQRFRHFMPYVLAANGGSLKGLRVLDIACNSGFWSLQCALLGADVVGFDARPELIEQANLVKRAVGVENVEFTTLNFFAMTPDVLGTFDLVLNLGVMYHLPDALDTLVRTMAMAKRQILLDTGVHVTSNPAVYLRWEAPYDIHAAADPGIVALPSRTAMDLMLEHVGASSWFEVPMRSQDMPPEYLGRRRTSWLITR